MAGALANEYMFQLDTVTWHKVPHDCKTSQVIVSAVYVVLIKKYGSKNAELWKVTEIFDQFISVTSNMDKLIHVNNRIAVWSNEMYEFFFVKKASDHSQFPNVNGNAK